MENQQYEFSQDQNALIQYLADKMKFVGIFGIVMGVLQIIGGFVGEKTGIFQGAFSIIIGVWTFKASKSFQQIVSTEGNDISNLMTALSELKKLYSVQYWVLLIAAIFFLVAIIAVLVMGGAGALTE